MRLADLKAIYAAGMWCNGSIRALEAWGDVQIVHFRRKFIRSLGGKNVCNNCTDIC